MDGHFAGQITGSAPTAEVFLRDREELFTRLTAASSALWTGRLPWRSELFNPYPFAVREGSLPELRALCEAIAEGLRQIVRRYPEDPRICERLRLDPALEEAIAPAAGRPYTIGTFRPDFVIDAEGEVRVCEINARFTANGYVISHLVDAALRAVRYLPPGAGGVRGMRDLPSVMTADLRTWGATAIVLRSESGDEIHALFSGLGAVLARPEELCVEDGAVLVRGEPVTHFVLELDRAELPSIDRRALERMILSRRCRNDVRTLSLVHDKRVLSLLSDPTVMADHLPPAQRALLARHIIPTFPATDPAAFASAMDDREAWVLKPSHGGRGVGVRIGHETPRDTWEKCLREEADRHTLQRFIPQRRFPIRHLAGGELTETSMNVVGLLPCFEGHFFGPGIFRASTSGVINVHQQRGEVLPCAVLEGSER